MARTFTRRLVALVAFSLLVPSGFLLAAPTASASHTSCPGSSSGLNDAPTIGNLGVGSAKWYNDDPISSVQYRLTSVVGNADLFVVRDDWMVDATCHEVCSRTGGTLIHTCNVGSGDWLIEVRCVSSATGACNYILERV